MIAYCGLDCSQCEGYLATKSNNSKTLTEVAEKWSKQFHTEVKPEHVICDGCKAGERKSFHCENMCKIRKCCLEKEYAYCIECKDFACSDLEFVLDHAPEARKNLEKLK